MERSFSAAVADERLLSQSPVIPSGSLLSHACSFCQRRKLKCDMQSPCTNCSKRSLSCFYVERLPGKKRGPKPKRGLDVAAISHIIPCEAPPQNVALLTTEVAKLRAEVANLRAEQVFKPQLVFSPNTEQFLREYPACHVVLSEFTETVVPYAFLG